MIKTKEVLIKLVMGLQSMEEEFSSKESDLPDDITKVYDLLKQSDFSDEDELINYAVNAIYDAYKNDFDRIATRGI